MATGAKSSNQNSDPQAAAQDVAADIRQLREDIAKLSEHLRETGSRSMSRARHAATQSADQLRDQAEEWQHDVAESVREKPLTALALAAGAGWLLAMMMRR